MTSVESSTAMVNTQIVKFFVTLSEYNIIILPTRYNSAAKGAAASRSKIWADTEYFVGQVAGGDFSNGGFGRTIAYSADGGAFTAETYRDEPIKSDVLRVYNSVDEVIINTNACEKITGA